MSCESLYCDSVYNYGKTRGRKKKLIIKSGIVIIKLLHIELCYLNNKALSLIVNNIDPQVQTKVTQVYFCLSALNDLLRNSHNTILTVLRN